MVYRAEIHISSLIIFSIGFLYSWATKNNIAQLLFLGMMIGVGNCMLVNLLTKDAKKGDDGE